MEKTVPLRGIVRFAYKKMGKAIDDYQMLSDGDRILVAVSGGSDSLALLKLFQMRKRRVPIRFDYMACFIEQDFIKVDTSVLIRHFQENNVEYVIRRLDLTEEKMNCFWCSWNRRKSLFAVARQYQCNIIALGHNLDDITETTLLNLFFLGEVSTSPPQLELFDGQIKIIRPLCYLEKKDIINFASAIALPVTGYECRYGKNGRRQRMREIIERMEGEYPFVKKNIFRALGRIKEGYLV